MGVEPLYSLCSYPAFRANALYFYLLPDEESAGNVEISSDRLFQIVKDPIFLLTITLAYLVHSRTVPFHQQ